MKSHWVDKPSFIYLFVIFHCIVWWIITIVSKANLDSYGDMLEAFAWSQHFLLGSDKHPQFLPWIIAIWFKIFPQSTYSFFALSATNLAVGLLGITALSKHFLSNNRLVFLAVATAALALPYLTLSSKLNMNSIGLATWPWAAWFLVKALEGESNRAKTLSAIGVGILSAITIMGKYHSVLLLATFFIITVMPAYLSVWKSPVPYVATVSFLVTIFPHLYWLFETDFAMFGYASEQGSGVELKRVISFMFVPLFYWTIPLGIILTIAYEGSFIQRICTAFKIRSANDILWYLATLPFIFTIILGALGLIVLSTPWSIPLGFAFTILLVRNSTKKPEILGQSINNVLSKFSYIWVSLLVLSLVYVAIQAYKGKSRHYNPTQLSSENIVSLAQTLNFPLKNAWVALGSQSAAGTVFYAPKDLNLEALPNYPDQLPFYYPVRTNWKNEPGLLVCHQDMSDCIKSVNNFSDRNSIKLKSSTFEVAREGLFFPKEIKFSYTVFWYNPTE